MVNQDLGQAQPAPPQRGQRGRATFTAYSKGPRTHKATNIGATPFHNVVVIFTAPPGRFTPSSRAGVPGYEEPGQSVPAITQSAPGLRVVVTGGEIVELVPGQPDRGMSLKLGEFYWQERGVTRAVRNNGTTRVELVEFELK
jgi:hypothetical protein